MRKAPARLCLYKLKDVEGESVFTENLFELQFLFHNIYKKSAVLCYSK